MTDFYVGARVRGKAGTVWAEDGEGVVAQVLNSRHAIVVFPDSLDGPTDGMVVPGQALGWGVPLIDLELIPNLPATNTGD